ncbi:MAG: hypothetical protein E6799_04885, partial [Dialister micraerophilus]|nr:hypothetical protein [Dialister micraerophilus]
SKARGAISFSEIFLAKSISSRCSSVIEKSIFSSSYQYQLQIIITENCPYKKEGNCHSFFYS